MRAEAAYEVWNERRPSERPLVMWQKVAADSFFDVLMTHHVSQSRAAAMLGVNDKRVGKYIKLEAHIPIESLLILPLDMAVDLSARIFQARSGSGVQALGVIRTQLIAIEKESVGATELGALVDIHGRIGALIAKAAGR